MKKFVFIILISIFAFVGCTSKTAEVKKVNTEMMTADTVIVVPKVGGEFSNPAIIYGSDFMSFMQSLRKTGNYEMMIKFTSSKSIKSFGKNKIETYYKEKFTNMSKLNLKSVTDNQDGSKDMNFVNLSVATKSAVSVTVVIENDSCKLVLPAELSKKLLN